MDLPTEFAMAAPVRLRTDFDATTLRRLAKAAHDPHQSRRLLALAVIYEGGSRSDAARIADVGLQTVRDWVLRFNAHGLQRSEEHTSELQSRQYLVCRLLLEKKKIKPPASPTSHTQRGNLCQENTDTNP